jgi:hypothetical protein
MTDSVLTSRHLWQMPVDDVLPEPNERIDVFAPSGPTATRDHGVAVVLLAIASIYWVGSLLAVIFGHVALNRIDRWNGWVGGKGMVTVAIVLGYVGLGCLALLTFRGILLGLSGRRSRTAPAV